MFKKIGSILFMMIIALSAAVPVYASAVTTASTVYGQGGSFTTNTANNGGISADSLNVPAGGVFDKNGNLYVADQYNNRVLYYPAGSTTATRVYGQGGSFTTNTANNGGISANSLGEPYDVALDGSGNLYVADCVNNRVLYYPAGNTTATRVYGQGGSFTTNVANKGGVSANSLECPAGVAVDKNGNLYISDIDNNRVLYYPSGNITATRVYGQGGSFTTNTVNKGGLSAHSLNIPGLITLDKNGNLYVVDYKNSRVLYYPSGNTTAIRVYGQGGSFTTKAVNKGGISANSLNDPWGPAVDGNGNLYVADYSNNRVLYYPAGSTTATNVYGQGGSFTTITVNKGGTSANSLNEPFTEVLDTSGNLYIFDARNDRVLENKYNSSASKVYGQGGSFTTNTTNKGGISANSLYVPAGGVFDKNGNLYVADQFNNRVLYYPAGSTTATRVYGQGGSFTTNTANKGGVSAKSLYDPNDVALDGSGNLYVSDCDNSRVLYYPAGSTTATRVYGQGGSFTTSATNKGGVSAKSLYCPAGVAVDKNGNLYISDDGNSRVLYYPSGSTTATRVYGQGGSFTTNSANKGGVSANSLNAPGLITLDNNGNLYVVDYFNSRVLYYLSGSTSAIRVYGQGGSFTTNTPNKGGISAKSLYEPWGPALDGSGNLYVADYSNNRVLYYPAGSTTATRVYGQGGSFTTNAVNNGGISTNSLDYPFTEVLDTSGNLYMFDAGNNRVLEYK